MNNLRDIEGITFGKIDGSIIDFIEAIRIDNYQVFCDTKYSATISNTEHTGMFIDFPVGDLVCLGYDSDYTCGYFGQKISETRTDLYSATVV